MNCYEGSKATNVFSARRPLENRPACRRGCACSRTSWRSRSGWCTDVSAVAWLPGTLLWPHGDLGSKRFVLLWSIHVPNFEVDTACGTWCGLIRLVGLEIPRYVSCSNSSGLSMSPISLESTVSAFNPNQKVFQLFILRNELLWRFKSNQCLFCAQTSREQAGMQTRLRLFSHLLTFSKWLMRWRLCSRMVARHIALAASWPWE